MKQNSKSTTRTVVYTLLILLIGVFLTYGFIYKFPKLFQETITKIERDVTVTDEGIADAVDNVYDSVIVVSNYKEKKLYASGSGFIYKVDGNNTYIITNHHVVKDGTSFKITYTDGSVAPAELLGGDVYADIAILKVETKEGIKAVSIGKSETLRVGDTTFTVGAPLDNVYSWTVTRGIISGKERLVEVSLNGSGSSDYVMNVLQTDAAVNSGNSGGPLCNSNGDVIGVVNAKISSTGVEGMGFAIPIEIAVEKAEQIIHAELSNYPYLGAYMLSINEAASYPSYYSVIKNSGLEEGVIIISVEDGSPAHGKLQEGDIIVKINNTKISNVAYLRYELYKHKVGDTIEITFVRNGKEEKASVKLSFKGEKY